MRARLLRNVWRALCVRSGAHADPLGPIVLEEDEPPKVRPSPRPAPESPTREAHSRFRCCQYPCFASREVNGGTTKF